MRTMDDVERARELIEGMELPDWVLRVRVRPYIDSEDKLALQVISVIPPEFRPDLRQWAGRSNAIYDLLVSEGITLYPYMRFVGLGDPDAR